MAYPLEHPEIVQTQQVASRAAKLLWLELNTPPVLLKFRSLKGLIGLIAFVAAFTVCIECLHFGKDIGELMYR